MSFLLILISQFFWIISLAGIGSLVFVVLRRLHTPPFFLAHHIPFLSGIMGLLILTNAGSISNFFTALNTAVSMTALLAGLLLFAINRPLLFSGYFPCHFPLLLSTFAAVWLLIPLRELRTPNIATYHLQVIKSGEGSNCSAWLGELARKARLQQRLVYCRSTRRTSLWSQKSLFLNPAMLFFYIGMVMMRYRKRRTAIAFSDILFC